MDFLGRSGITWHFSFSFFLSWGAAKMATAPSKNRRKHMKFGVFIGNSAISLDRVFGPVSRYDHLAITASGQQGSQHRRPLPILISRRLYSV